jgi:hypothetical protein
MTNPRLLPLRCALCGGPLVGAEQDVVFWCAACAAPQEVVGERFVARRGSLATAPVGTGRLLYLPIWGFEVRTSVAWPDPSSAELVRGLPPLERVYVTGFGLSHAAYFGDPGLLFTQRGVRLEPEAGRGRWVAGCVRGWDDALAYIEPHLLSILDRRADVTGATLEVEVVGGTLWGVPFLDEGERVRDGILGLAYPAAALMDLEAIRACGETR